MKKLLFLICVICFSAFSITFASETYVGTEAELLTACQNPSIDIVKLSANITISIDDVEWDGIEIEGKDRTIDFCGHCIYLNDDEQIRVNYRSSNTLTFTNTSDYEISGVFATNENRNSAYDMFKLYNYNVLESDVGMVIDGGYYICKSNSVFSDTAYFTLTINDGWFEYGNSLLDFSNSFQSDFVITKGTFKIVNGDESSYNRFSNSNKFSNKYFATKLSVGSYMFSVDSEDIYTDVTVSKVTTTFTGCTLLALPEEEAPDGILLPAIPDVSFVDGVLTWGEYLGEDLDHYYFTLSNGGGNIDLDSPREIDAIGYLDDNQKPTGTYFLRFSAEDENNDTLTRVYLFEINYEAPFPQLATPTNLRWEDDYTASWDAVDDATSYEVYIYKNSAVGVPYFWVNTANTYYDFSEDVRLTTDKQFVFGVCAESENNPESEMAAGDEVKYGWFEKLDLQNVVLSSEGVLSWDAFEGVDAYYYTLGSVGGTNGLNTSINLKAEAELYEFESGNYYYTVYGVKKINGTSYEITNQAEGYYTYNTQMPGDLSGNGMIGIDDVRMLLSAYINCVDQLSWTDSELYLMDLNDDDRVDVTDVRMLLLQYLDV